MSLAKFCSKDGLDRIKKVAIPTGTLGNYVYCTDWAMYEECPDIPVLYIDTHYDTVQERFEKLTLLDDNICVGTGFDNRVSCHVLYKLIRKILMQDVPLYTIVYCIFSNLEESGMYGMKEWLENRTVHDTEYFLVLDVTRHIPRNMGKGVYTFEGDPCEEFSQVSFQQICPIRSPYPKNLLFTHASVIFAEGLDVSRMGIPVYAMHGKVSATALSDVQALYEKLEKFVTNVLGNSSILGRMKDKVQRIREEEEEEEENYEESVPILEESEEFCFGYLYDAM